MDDIFARMAKAQYFSTVDFCKGYWQIPMADEDREKTAFVTPFGLFHFVRMPFGLQNAGATYTRMMRHVLDGMESTENFVDDVVLFRRVESTSPGTKKSICACQSSRIDGKAIKVSLWLS